MDLHLGPSHTLPQPVDDSAPAETRRSKPHFFNDLSLQNPNSVLYCLGFLEEEEGCMYGPRPEQYQAAVQSITYLGLNRHGE